MTPELLKRLTEQRATLDDIIVHNCSVSGSLARDLDKLYHEIQPDAIPTNFGCNACVFEMIKTLRNICLKFSS